VFNIGSGKPTAINELLELLLRITEREVDPIYSEQRLGDIRHSYADLGKAVDLLGYKPRVTLDGGLRKFIEWAKGYYVKR
jgi:nucleoside-diphosphate-sugar epimerase